MKWSEVAASAWHARWNALESEQQTALRAREEAATKEQQGKSVVEKCAARLTQARANEAQFAARIGPLEGEAVALSRQIAASRPTVERAIGKFNELERASVVLPTAQNAPLKSDATEVHPQEARSQKPAAKATETETETETAMNAGVTPALDMSSLQLDAVSNQQNAQTVEPDLMANGSASPLLETLRAAAKDWQQKWQGLKNAQIASRHDDLRRARAELERISGESAFLTRAIEELPEPARRPSGEFESELSRVRGELKEVGLFLQQLEPEIARREREHSEKARLEIEMQTREREHDLASELARLFGPRHLQRHLLREAERAIVREANSVLEAISGGTLRLELRTEGEDGTSVKVPKVLDVVCHHLSGSAHSRPIEPPFLSGSQRFRVAVALALGIGRTAARGANSHGVARVETILIDEGFGSLDKTGRDEMSDELRLLGRELGRIILVSHQEDFAQSFPARFDISMEAGVSRAQRIVE